MQQQRPKNWRDVGETLQQLRPLALPGALLPPRRLLRCGQVEFFSHEALGSPATIINLRIPPDDEQQLQGAGVRARLLHFPISNSAEKYDTLDKEVRDWLTAIAKAFEDPTLQFPVLVHCFSGKDRTGVVCAMLLHILGVPRELIIDEYLATAEGVTRAEIEQALAGLAKHGDGYFRRGSVQLEAVRTTLVGRAAQPASKT